MIDSQNVPRCKCKLYKFLRSDSHNRDEQSILTDPVGEKLTLLK